tara:strand:- start:54 stop:203 length:150 start_codon:yes stop_codon:yes gene_type:complete
MFKVIMGRLVKKHGVLGLLLKVGDFAVSVTKSKKDDKAWAKVKKLIKGL